MEQEQEIKRSIEIADLIKPQMENGFDISLFTKTELELMEKLEKDHKNIFRKRAEDLRFYPDTLNRKEKAAIFRCLTYVELKPYYFILAIKEKNTRLQQMLSMEKLDIRRYTRMTVQFSGSDCNDEQDLPDISIAEVTDKYFAIMKERGERVYEGPFYFLSDSRKENLLKSYAQSISTDLMKLIPKEEGESGQ